MLLKFASFTASDESLFVNRGYSKTKYVFLILGNFNNSFSSGFSDEISSRITFLHKATISPPVKSEV